MWKEIIRKCDRGYKMWQLLQSLTENYCKVGQVLQSVTVLKIMTENYYKVWQVLQNETRKTTGFSSLCE